ncbi:MAG: hypothetical protein LBN27_11125 [Prevotellaceae bacterium]|jgi:hypothetical protein|nr:hypothetical protein [Prevotellaceae bacterium]
MGKKVLYAIGAILFITCFFWVYMSFFKKKDDTTDLVAGDTQGAASAAKTKDEIKTIQRWVNSLAAIFAANGTPIPNAPLTVDGIVGSKTKGAVSFLATSMMITRDVLTDDIRQQAAAYLKKL